MEISNEITRTKKNGEVIDEENEELNTDTNAVHAGNEVDNFSHL